MQTETANSSDLSRDGWMKKRASMICTAKRCTAAERMAALPSLLQPAPIALTIQQAESMSAVIATRQTAQTTNQVRQRWARAQESARRRDPKRVLLNSNRYRESAGAVGDNKYKKFWTDQEDKLSATMREQGHTFRQIGFALDRSYNSVQRRFKLLREWDEQAKRGCGS